MFVVEWQSFEVMHTYVRGTEDLGITFPEFVFFCLSPFIPQMNFEFLVIAIHEFLVIALGGEANKSFTAENGRLIHEFHLFHRT